MTNRAPPSGHGVDYPRPRGATMDDRSSASLTSASPPAAAASVPATAPPASQSASWVAAPAATASASAVPPPSASNPYLTAGEPDLRASALYLNRELSWLEFNAHVLAETDSETVPLLERLKFHAIVAANLDEFFMVRVAGLKQQLTGEVDEMGPDGMSVNEQLSAIASRVHALIATQSRGLAVLLPKLADAGLVF